MMNVKIGDSVQCNYPKHGSSNILCSQSGIVEKIGSAKNGSFLVIKRSNGSYRSLNASKMVGLTIF